MKLEEIIKDLIYGELSAHGMCKSGDILEKDRPRVVAHINTVLTDLYTRFPLLTKELILVQDSSITAYHLHNRHAISNTASTDPEKYILDTPAEPFMNDVLRVDAVYDELGDNLLLNSDSACKVALTPAQDVLEIPNPTDTNNLFVIYRANHPRVELLTDELVLPEQFRSTLLAGVASRVYSGGTAADHMNISNNLFQKYELLCSQVELFGMVNKHDTILNKKPCLGGWV